MKPHREWQEQMAGQVLDAALAEMRKRWPMASEVVIEEGAADLLRGALLLLPPHRRRMP